MFEYARLRVKEEVEYLRYNLEKQIRSDLSDEIQQIVKNEIEIYDRNVIMKRDKKSAPPPEA